MNSKQKATLADVFTDPVLASIKWTNIEKMLAAVGADISKGKGSRVRVYLNDVRAIFHRPHPEKETDKGAVKAVRRFLVTAGVTPDQED
ncbi:MAG: type II toxin-antitoxin system HicA family toxin [Proteobacteria bacterium]|nr:type II toxin-antitoxin system HicA family toxin [Pseudomonadota bacterium]